MQLQKQCAIISQLTDNKTSLRYLMSLESLCHIKCRQELRDSQEKVGRDGCHCLIPRWLGNVLMMVL